MASDINVWTGTGRLTRDPEVRATAAGSCVLGMTLAVNRGARNDRGEWEEAADFVDVTVFGNRAEALSRILRKGMRVAVMGALRHSTWVDRDTGKNRSRLDVVAATVVLSDRQQPGSPGAQEPRPQVCAQQTQARAQTTYAQPPYADEDIPF